MSKDHEGEKRVVTLEEKESNGGHDINEGVDNERTTFSVELVV
jgi:hypothetical protein